MLLESVVEEALATPFIRSRNHSSVAQGTGWAALAAALVELICYIAVKVVDRNDRDYGTNHSNRVAAGALKKSGCAWVTAVGSAAYQSG
jgi:hypothetical protein